ncbi:Regulatory protein AfsR [Actinokineospora sp. UTMC 2448]|nr:Regulatory protein AfsR [Actinokineospora sp. UTMC 2448]
MNVGTAEGAEPVRFRVLGPVCATRGDEVFTVGGPGTRALLAMLLLDVGRSVPIARIVDVLWNNEPPTTARTIVQGYISRLRKWLSTVDPGGAVIETEGSDYRLVVDPTRVDLFLARSLLADARGRPAPARAELLARAQELWRGPELSDIDQRVRAPELAELRFTVIEARIDADLDLGRHDEVMGELAALVDTYPFREHFVAQFMLALYRGGRRAAALEVYQRFARRAAAEQGLEPGIALRELHSRVLRDDESLSRSPGPVTPKVGVVTPAELPAPPRGFAGREPELAWLDGLRLSADGTGPVIGVIAGPAGIGKSALAVLWGARNAQHFPDGVLHVSLRGFDQRRPPLEPAEALARFLLALGVAVHDVPTDLADRVALYRSLLAGRRVLVVLDDARDAEQVRPLLPGGGTSLALVTSRRRLDGLVVDGARLLVLDILSAGAAERVLEHVAGPARGADEAVARSRLVELCGYLPLALRIAGARLAVRPQWTVEDLVAELADERTRLAGLGLPDETGVRAALDVTLRGLDSAQAGTLGMLGVFPGQWFDVYAVAALCGVPVAEARARLHALAEAFLVVETRADVFGMHDLVRLFARDLAGDSLTPLRALLRYYTVVTDAARRQLRCVADGLNPAADPVPRPELSDRAAALEWFEREWPNLLACLAAGAEAGCHDLVWRLACFAGEYRRVRQRRDDWEWLVDVGLDSARAVGDGRGEVLLLLSRMVMASRFGLAPEHFADAERAVKIAIDLGDPQILAMAYNGLSSAHFSSRRYPEALDGYERALVLAREAGNRVTEGNLLNNIAQVHLNLDDPGAAMAPQRAAVAVYREVGDLGSVGLALANLAELEHLIGDYAAAEADAREAVSLAELNGQCLTEGFAREILSRVRRDVGDIEGARAELVVAIDRYDQIRSPLADSARAALNSLPPAV